MSASPSALNLYNLPKNLTAQSNDNNYAVLPIDFSHIVCYNVIVKFNTVFSLINHR